MILKGPNFNKFLRCSEAVESFDEQCITLEFIWTCPFGQVHWVLLTARKDRQKKQLVISECSL